MTLNEVRRSQSLPDVDGGDVVPGVNGVSTVSGVGMTPGAEEADTPAEVVNDDA